MNLVLVVFDSIFSIGCFTFSAAIQTWVYDNWDQLREEAGTLDIEQFAENFENSLISLGFFSFTISIGLIISNISILLWIPFNRFLDSVISSFSLIFIVFSSATIVIAFQTRTALDIWFQISQSEEWVCYLGITVSFIWTIVGCVGYYASLKKLRGLLKAYLGCMVFTTVLLCALGIFLIVFAYTLEGEVANKWSVIEAYLNEIGEAVPIEIFTQNLDEVVKFAGLYALAFFIFNLIGIGASSYQLNKSLLV